MSKTISNYRTRGLISTIIAIILLAAAGSSVLAGGDKVFVCKYVGTPGDNERLQTGQNPISVSVNSLKNFTGIGSFFNDKHGRSIAIAYDIGQPEPSASACPLRQTSSTPTPTPSASEPVQSQPEGSVPEGSEPEFPSGAIGDGGMDTTLLLLLFALFIGGGVGVLSFLGPLNSRKSL